MQRPITRFALSGSIVLALAVVTHAAAPTGPDAVNTPPGNQPRTYIEVPGKPNLVAIARVAERTGTHTVLEVAETLMGVDCKGQRIQLEDLAKGKALADGKMYILWLVRPGAEPIVRLGDKPPAEMTLEAIAETWKAVAEQKGAVLPKRRLWVTYDGYLKHKDPDFPRRLLDFSIDVNDDFQWQQQGADIKKTGPISMITHFAKKQQAYFPEKVVKDLVARVEGAGRVVPISKRIKRPHRIAFSWLTPDGKQQTRVYASPGAPIGRRKRLLESFKELANEHGVGYKPSVELVPTAGVLGGCRAQMAHTLPVPRQGSVNFEGLPVRANAVLVLDNTLGTGQTIAWKAFIRSAPQGTEHRLPAPKPGLKAPEGAELLAGWSGELKVGQKRTFYFATEAGPKLAVDTAFAVVFHLTNDAGQTVKLRTDVRKVTLGPGE